jgi:hypothetical protein
MEAVAIVLTRVNRAIKYGCDVVTPEKALTEK